MRNHLVQDHWAPGNAVRSVLLVEETGILVENHWQTLSHNIASSTPRLNGIWTHDVSGCTDCLRSCKSNYTIRSRPRRTLEKIVILITSDFIIKWSLGNIYNLKCSQIKKKGEYIYAIATHSLFRLYVTRGHLCKRSYIFFYIVNLTEEG